jgi:hypothetical protein
MIPSYRLSINFQNFFMSKLDIKSNHVAGNEAMATDMEGKEIVMVADRNSTMFYQR